MVSPAGEESDAVSRLAIKSGNNSDNAGHFIAFPLLKRRYANRDEPMNCYTLKIGFQNHFAFFPVPRPNFQIQQQGTAPHG